MSKASLTVVEPERTLQLALSRFGCASCEDLLPMIISRDTSWKAMLGKDERDATEEEVAALEAAHGPFLPADGEG